MIDQSTASGPYRLGETRPYSAVRILDLTHRYGSYAGRLFADLGAEVIRVEPPEGLPDRQQMPNANLAWTARFAFLNASKKSVALDTATVSGRAQLEHLLRSAQIVFVERDGPLFSEATELRRRHPSLIVTAISPFGMTGPLADAPASDLILQAAGGIAWMSGRIEDAPLSLPFGQATMVGSIYAATVTALALADTEASGAGHLIDVSVQECIAHSLQNAIQVWDLERRIPVRGGEGTRDAAEDVFPCKDGFIFLASPLALGNSWSALVGWMNELGHRSGALLSEPCWSDREWRLTRQARETFRGVFTDFTMDLEKEVLTREAIARRIVMGPVNRISDLFDDPQLAFRNFFRSMPANGTNAPFPGPPYEMTPSVWQVGPAPELGQHNALLTEARMAT